ncbi:hypothetical protein V499_06525 [Pseudogymnoascus sp. VKM F-103]|nr:hypothetical protein V499_06525 [Pseudogymnoascus sp. VKM F-103]
MSGKARRKQMPRPGSAPGQWMQATTSPPLLDPESLKSKPARKKIKKSKTFSKATSAHAHPNPNAMLL